MMRRSGTRGKKTRGRRVRREESPAKLWDVSDPSSESDYAPGADSSEHSDSDEQLDSDNDTLPTHGAIQEDVIGFQSMDEDEICDSIELEDLEDIEEQIEELAIDPELMGADTVEAQHRQQLFDGNVRPAEFYREAIKTLDLDDYKRKEYARGTEKLIRNTEDQWQTFVSHHHLRPSIYC